MKLNDFKIIVSGGAQGMGRHFAVRLVEAGASVAIGDVNEAGLAETVAECKAAMDHAARAPEGRSGPQGKVFSFKVDVSKEDEIATFVAGSAEKMGGLNGLINNAGILRDGLLVKKDKETGAIKTMTKDQWDAVIAVNLTGATLLARDVVKRMAETGTKPGVIVNMSSIARYGNRGQSNYSAAKAALAANTKTWAAEFATFGIRVGAVAPGMIETPMTQGMHQKARDALVAAIPVGRIGVPEDIWLAVKFVLECDYFDGRCIDVDGGLSM
jgi:3-oxoacyl-[acyl-carrier protein] reductase